MQIVGISLQVPSLRLTNLDVVGRLTRKEPEINAASFDKYCSMVEKLLLRSGASIRYVRDRSKGETAISLILSAINEALLRANISSKQIDLMIFCGVGRGFLEPSNAAFICRALKTNCDHFDVSDACMSWVRAIHIADGFIRAGTYEKILIVNAEFTTYELGNDRIFDASDPGRLRHTFPAYTIGEAATATVVVGAKKKWHFRFRSDTSLSPLCTVPLIGFEEFSGKDKHIGVNGIGGFASFGQELTMAALAAMLSFIKDVYADNLEEIDAWFPHAANGQLNTKVAEHLGISSRLYGRVFGEYGNIISASVPAGLALALEDGTLTPGKRFVLCPASAGLTVALVDGTY